jgi:hypothetical protein
MVATTCLAGAPGTGQRGRPVSADGRYGAGWALAFFLRAQSRSFSWKNSSGRANSVRKPLPVP